MIGYKSIAHQGWSACKNHGFNLDACPYPKGSQSAKEWVDSHFKASRGEHWDGLALRKDKKSKANFND